jgi:hypothetical protein
MGGTRVQIMVDNVLDVISVKDHDEGTSSSLAKLAEYLNKERHPSAPSLLVDHSHLRPHPLNACHCQGQARSEE